MSVKVGTFNVKNLFNQEDIVPGSRTRPKPEFEQKAMCEVIRRMDCDVLTLQECSSQATLQQALDKYGLSDSYKHVAWRQGNSERGINVAVISKYPFEKVVSHKDTVVKLDGGYPDSKFSRDLLRVDVNTDGVEGADLTVYTTHSKSRRPSDAGETPCDVQRLGEAKTIKQLVTSEMKEFPTRMWVVTGDMNDNTDDASVQAMLAPTAGAEGWVDSLAHLPANDRNTWPANPTQTHGHDPEQFDHILYAESNKDKVSNPVIHRFPREPEGSEFRWLNSAASDHIPTSVELDVAKAS